MDIVNKSLPKGKKFYPVEDVLCMPLEHLFKRGNIETIRKAGDVIMEAKANYNYWQMCHATTTWEVAEGDDEYPIITLPSFALGQVSYHFQIYTEAKKSNYLTASRLGNIKAPATPYVKVQYDPERKGLWFHDVEYEGELVPNKPMVVNKNLKSAIKTKIGELALEALIGAGDEDLVVGHAYYGTKADVAELAAELVGKILTGDYETTDLAKCAVCLGIYNAKYSNTLRTSVIDMDSPGTADFDITASARTKLIYHFGGYKLPDDYLDWFDK